VADAFAGRRRLAAPPGLAPLRGNPEALPAARRAVCVAGLVPEDCRCSGRNHQSSSRPCRSCSTRRSTTPCGAITCCVRSRDGGVRSGRPRAGCTPSLPVRTMVFRAGAARAAGAAFVRHDRGRTRACAPDRRRLLTDLAAGARLGRADIEELEHACARLSFALSFIRREIECAVGSRDSSTTPTVPVRCCGTCASGMRSPGSCQAVLHRVDGTPRRRCDRSRPRPPGKSPGAGHGGEGHLRAPASVRQGVPSRRQQVPHPAVGDRPVTGRTVIARLRDTIARRLEQVDPDGRASSVAVSFGVAPLDRRWMYWNHSTGQATR